MTTATATASSPARRRVVVRLGSTTLVDSTMSEAQFHSGSHSWKGTRERNEDTLICEDEEDQQLALWAVFDGHGLHGKEAAVTARDCIRNRLRSGCANGAREGPGRPTREGMEEEMREAFREAQEALERMAEREKFDEFGTTAVVCTLVEGDELLVAWAGDSRAMLCRGGVVESATRDHSLYCLDEILRINEAGGRVVDKTPTNRRVIPAACDFREEVVAQKKLALNMSRALGHHTLSRYGVSPEPEMMTMSPRPGDLLLLCSDGLLHTLNQDDIASWLSAAMSETPDSLGHRTGIKSMLKSLILASGKADKKRVASSDNTTCVAVHFNRWFGAGTTECPT